MRCAKHGFTFLIVLSGYWNFLQFHTARALYLPYKIGYLGASNSTSMSHRIKHLLVNSKKHRHEPMVNEIIDVNYRITNSCDVSDAINNLFDLLNGDPYMLVLVVYSCTEVLKVIGEMSQYINLTVLGLGSTSAVLKNPDKYPTLQLLTEVENIHSDTRVRFVTLEGWMTVATIAENYEDYVLAANNLYDVSLNSSVTVNYSIAITYAQADLFKAIDDIKARDLRIIFVFGSKVFVKDLLHSMVSTEFFNTKRVVISNQDVAAVPDTAELFYIGSASDKGLKASSDKAYKHIISNCVVQLEEYLNKTDINGHVGRADVTKSFSYRGDFTTSIYQFNHLKQQYDLVAVSSGGKLTNYSEINWLGSARPIDKKNVVIEHNEVRLSIIYVYWGLCVVGTAFAIGFLLMNCKYKHIGLIKLSSPMLNCINVIGALCLYSAVCVMGLSHPRLSKSNYQVSCVVRNFLLCVGYSLAFGPMCSKAYRVHYIITNIKHGTRRTRKILKDQNLLLFTVGLAFIDIVFILSWHLIDPFVIKESRTLEVERSDLNTDVYLVSYTCHSLYMNKWTGSVYAFKGALIVLGVYLAWTTRNISIPTLNDSKGIMLNIYVVLIASILIVTASMFLKYDATLTYSIVGCLILISTTVMMFILFIPKAIALYKLTPQGLSNKRTACTVVMHKTGLVTAGSNIRRLKPSLKEKVSELEIQSKALETEILKLKQEVFKLEGMTTKSKLSLSDYLTDDLLYMIPMPSPENRNAEKKPSGLTRRNTPKYKVERQKQKLLLLNSLKERDIGANHADCNNQEKISPQTANESSQGKYETEISALEDSECSNATSM